jgi:hypothetical protein
MADLRSLPPAEVAIAQILAPSLWAPQTRSWRPAQDQIDKPSPQTRCWRGPALLMENRPKSHRQTEHRVLAGPLGRTNYDLKEELRQVKALVIGPSP